tara:strand:+ start:471 stop:842 length:372 start_codon:yes stop_codon:yes gene_type:complete
MISRHGPMIAPSKCPAADEGEEGTVQGLRQTKTIPAKAKKRPRREEDWRGEDMEYQSPNGTIETGIQKSKNAWSISSIPLPKPRMFIISPLVSHAVSRILLAIKCGTPKYPTLVGRMLKVLVW